MTPKVYCKDCKWKQTYNGFIRCGWASRNPDEAMKLLEYCNRPANGYDFALEFGNFRNCPYFEKRPSLLKRVFGV